MIIKYCGVDNDICSYGVCFQNTTCICDPSYSSVYHKNSCDTLTFAIDFFYGGLLISVAIYLFNLMVHCFVLLQKSNRGDNIKWLRILVMLITGIVFLVEIILVLVHKSHTIGSNIINLVVLYLIGVSSTECFVSYILIIFFEDGSFESLRVFLNLLLLVFLIISIILYFVVEKGTMVFFVFPLIIYNFICLLVLLLTFNQLKSKTDMNTLIFVFSQVFIFIFSILYIVFHFIHFYFEADCFLQYFKVMVMFSNLMNIFVICDFRNDKVNTE